MPQLKQSADIFGSVKLTVTTERAGVPDGDGDYPSPMLNGSISGKDVQEDPWTRLNTMQATLMMEIVMGRCGTSRWLLRGTFLPAVTWHRAASCVTEAPGLA